MNPNHVYHLGLASAAVASAALACTLLFPTGHSGDPAKYAEERKVLEPRKVMDAAATLDKTCLKPKKKAKN